MLPNVMPESDEERRRKDAEIQEADARIKLLEMYHEMYGSRESVGMRHSLATLATTVADLAKTVAEITKDVNGGDGVKTVVKDLAKKVASFEVIFVRATIFLVLVGIGTVLVLGRAAQTIGIGLGQK